MWCDMHPARILSDGFCCILRLRTNFKVLVVNILVFLYTLYVMYATEEIVEYCWYYIMVNKDLKCLQV